MRLTPAVRSMWAVLGVVVAILLAIGTATDVLIFTLAYGSPLGSYRGQAHDRHTAWVMLVVLVILWIGVAAGMLWPVLRWKRRGMLAAGESTGR